MRPSLAIVGLVLLAGCPGGGADTGPELPTGWFTEPVDPECQETMLRTWPVAEQDDWYWRSPPTVLFATPDDGSYEAVLVDVEGEEIPTTPVWTGAQLTLELDASLEPSTPYTLKVADCRGRQQVPFETGPLGAPLEGGTESLMGRAYVFDMGSARWDQPPGIGALMSLYFTSPILMGVEWSSDEVIDLMGAQGFRNNAGEVRQYPSEPTWDFPVADFTEAPFFRATAPQVNIEFEGVSLIVYDFSLAATVSADGQTLGGGWVTGIGDTRYLGPALNLGNAPGATCGVTEDLGAPCEPCPDGEPYCLRMSARDATGRWVEGLRIERVE